MITEKTLAVLLAGLITLSLAGCAADKANDNTKSGAVSTESRITATVTDSTSEPTAESSLPAESEIKTDESTAEKAKAESTAPADSGKTEAAKPTDTESPKQTETTKVTETPKQAEPPKVTEPPETKPTEPSTKPTEPPATEQPKGFTEADHTRIVSEVKVYAESYTAKGFTFEWAEELAFGWDVGWMGTPRISRDGIDGVISTLKHHVDLIYKTGTDPANGVTANSVRYKVVQLEIDGGIAYAVIYG